MVNSARRESPVTLPPHLAELHAIRAHARREPVSNTPGRFRGQTCGDYQCPLCGAFTGCAPGCPISPYRRQAPDA